MKECNSPSTLTCLYYKEKSKYLQTIFSLASICKYFLSSPILSLSLSISLDQKLANPVRFLSPICVAGH